jgi:hypothetical protein
MPTQNVLHRFCFANFAFFFYLLVSLAGKFPRHSFLQLFSVNAVAFGGIHENVVSAGGGSLIRRIQQADFQK